MEKLKRILSQIDGRGYKAYKELQGKTFRFPRYSLCFQYIQGDPYAPPSQVALSIPLKSAGFRKELFSNKIRRIALEDFLARSVDKAIEKANGKRRGSGKSGLIAIDVPKQEVIERTCMRIFQDRIEARLFIGLPARGRRIAGDEAMEMFFEDLPEIAESSLFIEVLSKSDIWRHVCVVEDQNALRSQLEERGLVAFIANGSLLPRRSGVDQRPLKKDEAVLFESPPSMEVELNAPNAGKIRGMGIPRGITLIVGGGFHGKSTLLSAIERSVYDHIPDDGREYVVTLRSAVKIRAEDGRRVECVDISPFISNLPFGKDTLRFRTDNASGSTSQAANIIEAIEAGAKLLLLDEDTSATNFMIRDARMQRLVAANREPITPFIDRARQLFEILGVSTVLVMGGSGDYFDIADRVVLMDHYRPQDVTSKAREIAGELPSQRVPAESELPKLSNARIPLPESFNPMIGKKVTVRSRGKDRIQFGRTTIDLTYVEQIAEESQTRAIGGLLLYAVRNGIIDGKRSVHEIVKALEERIDAKGLEVASPFARPSADYARPRPEEICAAINRLRTLVVR